MNAGKNGIVVSYLGREKCIHGEIKAIWEQTV